MPGPSEAGPGLAPDGVGRPAAGLAVRAMRRLAYSGRNRLGSHASLYPLLRINRPGAIVTRDTDVCIEGFPRSANTFAFFPFSLWNPGVRVAHHLHVPMQVRRAVALGVPCVVLIRRPLDALSSLLLMDGDRLGDAVACRSYINFYARTLDLRDEVVTCTFEEVTADPFVVVDRLNRSYGTSFEGHPLDAEERVALARRIERYHRREEIQEAAFTVPSEGRQRLKQAVRARLVAHPLLEQAELIYRAWLGRDETR